MFELDTHPSGRHFLQIPGPDQRARTACCGRSTGRRSIIAAPSSRGCARDPRRAEESLPDRRPRRHLPGVGHRRVGSGARQHAVARRPRADVRDRPLRDAVARDGRAARPRRRLRARRLAQRRRSGASSRRSSPRTARTRSRPCCVVHNETSTGVTSRIADVRAGDRSRRPSGAVHGRHDLVARLDRLPPRRMGRRRHRRRLAEGPDAAARACRSTRSATRRSRRASTRSCRARTGAGTRRSR